MAKAHQAQSNFSAGELSPRMLGRSDSPRFLNGAREIRNLAITPHGNLQRRGGTRLQAITKYPDKSAWLRDFEVADTISYILELGDYYIRFYRNDQVILRSTAYCSTATPSSGTDSCILMTCYMIQLVAGVVNNGAGLCRVTTTTPHYLLTGCRVRVQNVTGTTEANGNWVVTRISDTQVDLQGTTFVNVYAGGGEVNSNCLRPGDNFLVSGVVGCVEANGYWRAHSVPAFNQVLCANSKFVNGWTVTGRLYPVPYELTTTYPAAVVGELCLAQSADVAYISHRSYPVRKLMRYGDEDWELVTVEWMDGPYLPKNSIAPNFASKSGAPGTYDTRILDAQMNVDNYQHVATAISTQAYMIGDLNTYIEYTDTELSYRFARITAVVGGAFTATINIKDNVLRPTDPTMKLSTSYNQGYISPGTSTFPGAVRRTDESVVLTTPAAGAVATITSNKSNTFSKTDMGKWLRVWNTALGGGTGGYQWWLIEGVTSDTVVTSNTLAVMASTVTGTNNFVLTAETRLCDITAMRGNASMNLFRTLDVGRLMRLGFSGEWTWGRITTYVTPAAVTLNLMTNLPRSPVDARNYAMNGRTYDWRLGAWADPGSGSYLGPGYPAMACFHEQRLILARTDAEGQTLWMSRPASYEDMAPTQPDSTVQDDSAITYTLVSDRLNPIKWIISGPVLLVGGWSGEWQCRAGTSIMEPITPTNISVTPQTSFGSESYIKPIRIGSRVLFIERKGKKLREMSYNFQLDSFESKDISLLAEHLLRNGTGARQVDYQRIPVGLYWILTQGGKLLSVTYDLDQDVIAWSQHDVGGSIKSMVVIPTISDPTDRVYCLVSRTVGGLPYQTIECFDLGFDSGQHSRNTMVFLDAATVRSGTAITFMNGLGHLEGVVVDIMLDGVYAGSATVSSGKVSFAACSNAVVGAQMVSQMQSMPPEGGGVIGTSQITTKRINKVGVRVKDTISFQYSADGINFMDKVAGTTFITGDVEISLAGKYDLMSGYFIRQNKPYPLEIVMVAPKFETYEEQ